MLDRIEFILGEAFSALRRNTWMTFAAVSTSAVALFLLGGLGYVYIGISRYMQSLPSRFEVRVFLQNDTSRMKVSETAAAIRKIGGVGKVIWIPREQAWAKFQRDYPELTTGEDNPLPDSFRVTLTELDKAPEVAAKIRSLPSVDPDGVKYLDDLQQLLSEALVLLRAIGLGVGGLMLLTAGVLIYNAIRLTIVARRREIRIMRLVGATRLMVSTPMLVEGIVQGSLGGLVAALLLWSSNAAVQRLVESMSSLGKLATFPLGGASLTLMALGAAYGLICSAIAVRDPGKRVRGAL